MHLEQRARLVFFLSLIFFQTIFLFAMRPEYKERWLGVNQAGNSNVGHY